MRQHRAGQVGSARQPARGHRAAIGDLRQHICQRHAPDSIDRRGPALLLERCPFLLQFGACNEARGAELFKIRMQFISTGRGRDTETGSGEQRHRDRSDPPGSAGHQDIPPVAGRPRIDQCIDTQRRRIARSPDGGGLFEREGVRQSDQPACIDPLVARIASLLGLRHAPAVDHNPVPCGPVGRTRFHNRSSDVDPRNHGESPCNLAPHDSQAILVIEAGIGNFDQHVLVRQLTKGQRT